MNAASIRQHVGIAASPFAGSAGRNVTIAVIDSGVHPDHSHIAADRLGPGIMVMPDGTVVDGTQGDGADVWLDRLGHGTAVTAAIQEKAPDALCLPVRVFRESLKTSAAALIAAIRWSIARNVDIINLSLGTTNAAHREAFAAVADEAAAAGIILVAARAVEETPCYPGALDSVIGVAVDWDCPRTDYGVGHDGDLPIFRASGYPRPIAGVPQRRNLYGISFAVAQMSGFIARACEARAVDTPQRDRLDQVRHLLSAQVDTHY